MRLAEVIEKQQILSDKQFGFRKGKSTQDAILVLSTVIEKAKHKKDDAAFACMICVQRTVRWTAIFCSINWIKLGLEEHSLIY